MKTAFLVLGAQRSGTSASSHLLSKFGIDFGDSHQFIQADFNPVFFELKWVNDFNNLIIEALGYQYTDFFLPVESDFKVAGTYKVEPFLHNLIDAEWPSQEIIGFKDPRFSLTFPVWEQVLLQKGYRLNVIHVFRRPANMLSSNRKLFHNWAGWTDIRHLNFWLQLNLAATYFTRNYPVHYIDYEHLMSQPFQTTQQLVERFQLDSNLLESAAAVINPQHCHHHQFLNTQYPFVDRCYDLLCTQTLTPEHYLQFRDIFVPSAAQQQTAV